MSKNNKTTSNLGRDENISPEELVRRYAALKRFLEDNWGRIGQKFPRARTPETVKTVLNSVRDAKWCPAFRDFPLGCLLLEGTAKVGWRELRETRAKLKDVRTTEGQLLLEFHKANQAAQGARTAFKAVVAECMNQQESKNSQRRLKETAKRLRFKELTNNANEVEAEYRAAQLNRERLAAFLRSQEAWFARNEVVGFVRDAKQRYRKTPANFAKAMAGLPFYDWLYSIRQCLSIPEISTIPATYWFQVFEMLEEIVESTKPPNLRRIERKLKKELLKTDTDVLLQSYISPQWHYMMLAFADCRGKKLRRTAIPYRIMARFLDYFEGPSAADVELAKHNQLLHPESC